MPTFIVKADPDKDLYVEWSTIVDAPIQWGTAEELSIPEDRKERADLNGTSMRDDDWFGWDDEEFIIYGLGSNGPHTLPRKHLYDFLMLMSENAIDDKVTSEQIEVALARYTTKTVFED